MATSRRKAVEDHARKALEFLEHSDREFVAGDESQGSEKLWGAASQAVMAIAKQRGWRYGKSGARATAVTKIAEEYDEPLLVSDYGLAEAFHANFYHEFMEDDVIERDRPLVHRFVHRILDLAEGPKAPRK